MKTLKLPITNGTFSASDVTVSGTNDSTTHNVYVAFTQADSGYVAIQYKVSGSNNWQPMGKVDLTGTEVATFKVSGIITDWRFVVANASGSGSIEVTDSEKLEDIHPLSFYGETGGMSPDEIGDAISTAATPDTVGFIGDEKNLFDKSTVTVGIFISGTSGNIQQNATYDASDYIAVDAGETYSGRSASKPMRFHAFYNSDRSFISGGSDSDSTVFTAPAGAAFVRVTVHHSEVDSFQLERGVVNTAFLPYGARKLNAMTEFRGRSITTFGDSITAQNKWQPYVASAIGFKTLTNKGVGGSMVSGSAADAMWQDARINDIPTTSDVVMFMGGTNDWAQSMPLGAITDTDPTASFYGGLNTVFEKLFTRLPYARIFANTTPYGELIDLSTRPLWADGATNNNGHTTNDYAECVRRAAERWGVHVVDVAAKAGINKINIGNFMVDDGGNLHPDDSEDVTNDIYNDSGANRIASVVVCELSSFVLNA